MCVCVCVCVCGERAVRVYMCGRGEGDQKGRSVCVCACVCVCVCVCVPSTIEEWGQDVLLESAKNHSVPIGCVNVEINVEVEHVVVERCLSEPVQLHRRRK